MYEGRKAIVQSKGKRCLYEKCVRKEGNRVRNFINKLASQLIRTFPTTLHIFEDLKKEDMISRDRLGRRGGRGMLEHRRKTIHGRIGERALTEGVPARNTTRT